MSEGKSRFEKAERILDILSWASLVVILLCVLFTILHLNRIIYWPAFKNYLLLELSLFSGLLLWATRFYFNSRRYTSYLKYSIFSFVFALIQLIFIVFTVY